MNIFHKIKKITVRWLDRCNLRYFYHSISKTVKIIVTPYIYKKTYKWFSDTIIESLKSRELKNRNCESKT